MGSKRSMLKNGLGKLLLEQSQKSNRIFDPFCGSASVAWFIAENTENQVIAGDLQKYSIDLAQSVILRNSELKENELFKFENWINLSKEFFDIIRINIPFRSSKSFVLKNRDLSSQSCYKITHAYGGYYFSYEQGLKIDSLLNFLPEVEPLRSIAISAVLEAASQCAASPGHTAQPFNPEANGLIAINEAWKRDPFNYVEKMIIQLSGKYAKKVGQALVSNAEDLIDKVGEGDLVFLDPPYSGVHYSRFYHVFETISRNNWVNVSGVGRYPPTEERPKSNYSLRGKSYQSLDLLLSKISSKKASAIITFPTNDCSNGLSGKIVKELACKYFNVKKEIIEGKFSTLGGNNSNRPARQSTSELVLLLEQK